MPECKKKRYPSKLAADMALTRIWTKKRERRAKSEGRAYYCKHCSAWHLTSQPLRR